MNPLLEQQISKRISEVISNLYTLAFPSRHDAHDRRVFEEGVRRVIYQRSNPIPSQDETTRKDVCGSNNPLMHPGNYIQERKGGTS